MDLVSLEDLDIGLFTSQLEPTKEHLYSSYANKKDSLKGKNKRREDKINFMNY